MRPEIVSVSINYYNFRCLLLRPAMRLTQEWLYGPRLDLWLVGWLWPFAAQYRSTHQEMDNQLRHIEEEETTSDCPPTMPWGPGTVPLSRACRQQHSSPHLHLPQAATIHRGPPANLSGASKQHILTRGRPDASSLHSSPTLRRSQHSLGKPSSRHKTKHVIPDTALGDPTN